MNAKKRLTAICLMAAAAVAGTMLTASPALARDEEGCSQLRRVADWNTYMWQWSVTFFGDESPEARGYAGASVDAMKFHEDNCY